MNGIGIGPWLARIADNVNGEALPSKRAREPVAGLAALTEDQRIGRDLLLAAIAGT